MPDERPNFYAGAYIERRTELREDPDWIAAARDDPGTRYVVAHGSAQLLRFEPDPAVALLGNDAPLVAASAAERLVLLGWFRGARCVLIDVPPQETPELPAATRFEELRPLSSVLPAEEAGLLAYARALTLWRARHRHCGACGSVTAPTRGGHCLVCVNPQCAQESFPRIDPAIIVLVSDGERALLGRQASWPPRRYSTIAGFVEPGESLEDAVAREVDEETGVAVHDVRYHSSQPWPFPAALMLGFRARATPGAAVRVGGELEDARWVSRAQLAAGEVLAPPSHSISWRLIEGWIAEGG